MATILIVDPDSAGNKLLGVLLKDEGHVVVSCGSLREARAILATLQPMLVVLELAQRDGDGLALVTELRATADLPIVAITALNEPTVEYRALAAGCADYIRKPIDVMTIAVRLASAMGGPRREALAMEQPCES